MRLKRIRSKLFSQPQPTPIDNNSGQQQPPTPGFGTSGNITSKDLMLEQMRQQRQWLQTQRLRQRLQAQEKRDQMKASMMNQKRQSEEDKQDLKNSINIKKVENQSSEAEAKNVGLYKTRSRALQPVPMKH